MRTKDLRAVIQTKLLTVCDRIFYRIAPDDATVPYATFDLSRVSLDLTRDTIDLCIDVFDIANNPKAVDDIADAIEDLFNPEKIGLNVPEETVLPTFFPMNRYPVGESDKTIQHEQLHFEIQSYDRTVIYVD